MRSFYYIIPILMLTACAAFEERPVSPGFARAQAKCMREAQQTYGEPPGISPAAMEKREYIRYCIKGEGY